MPVFNARHMKVYLEDASGKYKIKLGPGPGDASWPDVAEDGADVAVIKDAGRFLGRVKTEDLEGEVSITLHQMAEAVDRDALFDAITHAGSWSAATTCDPGGQVWAPSLLIQGEVGGETFAIRWTSARVRFAGSVALGGNTLNLTAQVVGAPLYGADAIAWPT